MGPLHAPGSGPGYPQSARSGGPLGTQLVREPVLAMKSLLRPGIVIFHTGLSPDSRGANANLYVILEGLRSYRYEPWQPLAANRQLEGGALAESFVNRELLDAPVRLMGAAGGQG